MLDNEFFTLMVVVFAIWLLTDDVRRGLKDQSIKLPVNVIEPGHRQVTGAQVAITAARLKSPVPVFTQTTYNYRREEATSASAGKALGMH